MAYLPNFAHDVFISYAHDDDIPRWEKENGWVTNFIDALERQLPSHLDRGDGLDRQNLAIWKDSRSIRGADFYDDKIERAVKGSAVMISVMSKNYFKSSYCRQELQTFCDHSDIAVEFEDGRKSRVIKLLLSDIFEQQLDPRISRIEEFKFYGKDKEGQERKFMRTLEGTPDDGYWGTLEQLASEVGKVLTGMAGRRPSAPAPSTGVAVYLAEVTDDLEEVRMQVRDALIQQGIRVFPEIRLPLRARELREEVARNLEQSALSVHLMGPLAGKAPDQDHVPATHIQYQLASAQGTQGAQGQSREPLRRIVWLSPDLVVGSVPSQTQRTFLEGLRYEQDAESPMELIQKSVEELKDEIVKKVLPPKERMRSKFEPNRTALIYVVHHPSDEQDAALIMNKLSECKQDVLLMRGKDKPEQMKDLRTRMLGCNAVLILYGRSPLGWVHDVTLKARHIAKKREERSVPLYAKSICDGPPDPKDDLGLSLVDWQILRCREGIDQQALEPFIKAVAIKS